jgi:hypothetical protein
MIASYLVSGVWCLASVLVTPAEYIVGMEPTTLVHSTKTANLMAMSNYELERWFDAFGFTVEVVARCGDPMCPDCTTVEPAQAA